MQCRLRGLSLPATYTEKDEFDCVRTFSCLLCPEALNTVKELEEHVVGKIVFDGSSFPPGLSNYSTTLPRLVLGTGGDWENSLCTVSCGKPSCLRPSKTFRCQNSWNVTCLNFYFSILLVLRCKMTFAQIALKTARRCRLWGSVQTAGS